MEFREMQEILRKAGYRKKLIGEMQREILQLEQQIEQLREYKSAQITGMPYGGGSADVIGSRIVQIEKLEKQIKNIIYGMGNTIMQNEKIIIWLHNY